MNINIERTSWRDNTISQWHRQAGKELSCLDLDFCLIEYSKAIPKAIIEYKSINRRWKLDLEKDYNLLSLKNLGDMANIPSFIVLYSDDFQRFGIKSLNNIAKLKMVNKKEIMNENEYINFLYFLRELKNPNL